MPNGAVEWCWFAGFIAVAVFIIAVIENVSDTLRRAKTDHVRIDKIEARLKALESASTGHVVEGHAVIGPSRFTPRV